VGAPLGADHALAIALIGLELMVLVAIATFFSAFTTPMLAALFTVGLWLIGHLSRDLYALGQQSDLESVSRVAGFVFVLMPDLEVFNKTLEAVHGLGVQTEEVGMAVLYAIGYTVCTLLLGSMIFSRRDFK
jgi:ABC-type transport system involved in multi-copper enzyme maturation permease subunit